MRFASTRIITDDITRLVAFYERATGLAATWYTDDYAELEPSGATLAIGSTRSMALFGAGAARGGENRSVILEFRVPDVDRSHEALRDAADIVQSPVTQPWGNRSLLFRDPDRNLVNFFTPVTEAAIARADRHASR